MTNAEATDTLAEIDHDTYPLRSWWDDVDSLLSGLDGDGLRAVMESCREVKRSGYAPECNEDLMYATRRRLKQIRD